jgi:hypothetical protein
VRKRPPGRGRLLKRIEWAGPDIPIHDTQRREGHGRRGRAPVEGCCCLCSLGHAVVLPWIGSILEQKTGQGNNRTMLRLISAQTAR